MGKRQSTSKVRIAIIAGAFAVAAALVGGVFLLMNTVLEHHLSLTVPTRTTTTTPGLPLPIGTSSIAPGTAGEEWPMFQDDFDDTQYDGRYNPSLWSARFEPDCGEAEQRNGVLVLACPDSCPEGDLYMWTVHGSPGLEGMSSAEAKLMLDSDFKGRGGPGFSFHANLETHGWGTGCFIRAHSDGRGALVTCEAWTLLPLWITYHTEDISVSYDQWYVLRIETNPETMGIVYYLDDQAIGSYTPIDDAPALREAEFYSGVGLWHDANSHIIGYIDDVRFGPHR